MKMRFALTAVLALVVSACTGNIYEVTVSPCPAVAVVGDLGTVTRFNGDGRDTDDISYTASITDARISCLAEDGIASTVTFDIIAEAGPALMNSTEKLYYFVAVMKDNHLVVTKKIYDVDLRFGSSDGRITVTQTIQNYIPSRGQAQKYDYEILIGLQVTPEEAVYNIAR